MKTTFAALSAAVLLAAAPASATLYQFDYSGTSSLDGAFSASLQIEVPVDGGVASAIGGTRNGVAVTGLSDYAGADNKFSQGYSYTSFYGLGYTAGGIDYNVYYDGSALYEINSASNPDGEASTDALLSNISVKLASATGTAPSIGGSESPDGGAVSPVPEAATWMTMLVGFGALGGMLRRRSARGMLAAI